MSATIETLHPRAARSVGFQPGRESLWESANPIAADGSLQDILYKAQECALDAVIDLHSAARCSGVTAADGSLSEAAIRLRKALDHIEALHLRLQAVPAGFGEV